LANVVEITVKATDQNATATAAKIKAAYVDLGNVDATPSINVQGAADAEAQAVAVDDVLKDVGKQNARPSISLSGASEAAAEAKIAGDAISDVGTKASKDATDGLENLGSTLGKLSNLAFPAAVGAGVILSPVIATLGTGFGGLGFAAEQTIDPIMKAASATGGLQANMSTLNPVQQTMAEGLLGLQAKASAFTSALQPEVVSLWGQALSIAGGILTDVEPVASATGKALGGVVTAIGADLKTAEWQNFFQFMASTAGPDVQLVGQNVEDLANDLPQLIMALQPLATEFLQITDLTAKVIGGLEGIPGALNATAAAAQKQSSANPLGWLQDASDWLNDLSSHMPGGNKTLLQLVDSGNQASTAVGKLGANATAAAPAVGTLSGDVAILSSSTATAAQQTTAFSDAWLQFVGKSVSDQQAVLSVNTAFDTYNQSLKTNKQDSDAAQTAFLGIITSMGTGLSTLQTNGATVNTVNQFYQTNIDKLNALHNLTPAQRADVQGITKDYNAWANASSGLSGQITIASNNLKNSFLANLDTLGVKSPTITGDLNNLSNAVQKTGTDSSATSKDRQQLIADLENAGLSATNAKNYVNNLITSIGKLQGKTVDIGVYGEGSGGVKVNGPTTSSYISLSDYFDKKSAGGLLPGFGGGDVHATLLESGEAVVDKNRTRKYANVLGAMGVPGMASGGVVGWEGDTGNAYGNAAVAPMKADVISALTAAVKAVTVSQQGNPQPGPGGGTPAANYRLAQALYPEYVGTPVMTAWNNVAMRESGWNQYATNPSSGAYGIAQALPPTKMPFAAQRAGGSNPTAQEEWMWDYMATSYGGPIGAWQHELNYGWYDQGGGLQPGWTMAYNGTGKTEQVVGPNGSGQTIHVQIELGSNFRRSTGLTDQQLADLKYTVNHKGGGDVQKAFGRNW
jgi:hypothetical protein